MLRLATFLFAAILSVAANAQLKSPTYFNTTPAGPGELQLTWSSVASPAKGYRIYRNGVEIATIQGVGTTQYVDRNPIAGQVLQYCITSLQGAQESPFRNCLNDSTFLYNGFAASDSASDAFVDVSWSIDAQCLRPAIQNGNDIYLEVRDVTNNKDIYTQVLTEVPADTAATVSLQVANGDYVLLDQNYTGSNQTAGYLQQFGRSVAMDGNYAVVGAPKASMDSGAVYIYEKQATGWVRTHRLKPAGLIANAQLGYAVDMDSNFVIASAPGGNGAAYVFERVGAQWIERATLTEDILQLNDGFGEAVAISQTHAFVGAPLKYGPGVVYFYQRSGNNWNYQRRQFSRKPLSNQRFGSALAYQSPYLIVGSPGDQNARGAAYIYEQWGAYWIYRSRIQPGGSGAGDQYGTSVAIQGKTIAMGAPGYDNEKGDVVLFKKNSSTQWLFDQRIAPAGLQSNDHYGAAVALYGQRLLAAAPTRMATNGSAYMFTKTSGTWVLEQELVRPGGASNDGFGRAMALGQDVAFIGAPFENTDQGTLYQFDFDGTQWVLTTTFSSIVTGSLTFEAWVKLDGTQANGYTPLLADDNVSLNLTAPGDLRVNFMAGSVPVFFNYQVPVNRWTHLAFVTDSIVGSTKLYVNGILADEIDFLSLFGVEKLGTATIQGTTYHLNGDIRDVRYWNVARSASEIAQRYDVPLTNYPSGLVGYWKVDEGTGTSLAEATGNYAQPAIYQPSGPAVWQIDSMSSTISGYVQHAVGPDKMIQYEVNTYEIGFGNILCPTLQEVGSTLPYQAPAITVDASRPDSTKFFWTNRSDAVSYYRMVRDGMLMGLIDSTVEQWADAFRYNDSTSLVNGQTYRYCLVPFSVRFTDQSGNSLVYDSICVPGTTLPIHFAATDNVHPHKVALDWNTMSTFGDRIEITRDRQFFAQLDSNVTQYDDTDPIPGRQHEYEWKLLKDGEIVVAANDTGSVTGVGTIAGYVVTPSGQFAVRGDTIRATSVVLGDTIVLETTAGLVGNFRFDNVFYNTGSQYTITLHPYRDSAINTPIQLALNAQQHQYEMVLIESEYPIQPQGTQPLSLSNFTAQPQGGNDAVTLQWNYTSSDTTWFQIFRNGVLLAILSDSNNTAVQQFVDTEAMPGDSANYSLVAYVHDNDTLVTTRSSSQKLSVPDLTPVDSLHATVQPLDGNVHLQWWHTSTENEGFYLYRNDSLIATMPIDSPFVYTDDSGIPGTAYVYSIVAFDHRQGVEVLSDKTQAVPAPVTYPDYIAPQMVTATPLANQNQMQVTFRYPVNGNQNFYGFRITRHIGGLADTLVVIHKDFVQAAGPGQNTYQYLDHTGKPGQGYTYAVAMIKRQPAFTGPEGTDKATFPSVTPPANFVATASAVPGAIDLSWTLTATNIDGFLLLRDGDTLRWFNSGVHSFTDGFASAANANSSNYTLTAYRQIGRTIYHSSPANASASATTQTASSLKVPQDFVASDQYPSHVQLSWNYPPYVLSRFFIYRDGVLMDSLANNVRYYYDTSAVEGQTYLYQIRAEYQGSWSNIASDAGSLRSLMQIEGVAQTQQGFGIPNVQIDVRSGSQVLYSTTTDAAGFYRLVPVQKHPGDTLTVTASGPNAHFVDHQNEVAMKAGEDRYVVNFIDTFYQRTIPTEQQVAEITEFMASIDPLTNKVELRWNTTSTNYTGFRLYRGLGQIADINGLAPKNYLDLIAAPGFGYVYSLEAYWELPSGTQVSAQDTAVIQVPQIYPVEALQAIPDSDEDVVKLFWSHPNDRHTYYEIKRNGVVIASVPTGSRLTYVDTNGLPTYNYTYVVTAVEVGASGFYTSPERVAKARFPEVAPVTDLQLTAVPGENRVDVSWRHTSRYYDNAIIYRGTTAIDTVAKGQTPKISADYWGLPDEINHYTVMVEVEKEGLVYESDTSWKSIMYPSVVAPSIIDTSFGMDALTLEGVYTAPKGYTGFQFFRDSTLLEQRSGKRTNFSFTDPDAQPNGNYTYKIRAFKTVGKDYYSAFDSIDLRFPALTRPFNLEASDGAFFNNILVTWDYNSGSNTGFELYRINAPGDTVLIATVDGGLREYNDVINTYSQQGDPDPQYFVRALKMFEGSLYRSGRSNIDTGYAEIQRFSLVSTQTGTTANGHLGTKVDLDQDYGVAADRANTVQVFSRGGVGNFQPTQVLTPDPASGTDPDYGRAVHLTDNRLLVSAPRASVPPPQAITNGTFYAFAYGDLNGGTESVTFYIDGQLIGTINPSAGGINCLAGSGTFTIPQSVINNARADGFTINAYVSPGVDQTGNVCVQPYIYFRFIYTGLNYLGLPANYDRSEGYTNVNSGNNNFQLNADQFEIGEIYVYNKNNGVMDSSTIIRPYGERYVKANIFTDPDTTYVLGQSDTTQPDPIIKKGKSPSFTVALTETQLAETAANGDIRLDTVFLRMSKNAVSNVYLKDVNLVGVNPAAPGDTMRWELFNNTTPGNGSANACVIDQSSIDVKFVASSSNGTLQGDCPGYGAEAVYQAVDFSAANSSGLDPNGDYWIEYTIYVDDQSITTTDTTNVTISIEEVELTFKPLQATPKTTFLPGSRLGITLAGTDNIVYAGSPYLNGSGGAGVFSLSGNDYAVTPSIMNISGFTNVGLGWAAALVNDVPVLSAPGSPIQGINAGVAVDFTRDANDQFEVNEIITRSVPGGSDLFGQSDMDAYEDLIIIGNPTDDYDNYAPIWDVGSAYVFRQEKDGSYTELAKLKRPDAPVIYDSMGTSVAIFGTQIAVGAPGIDLTGNRTDAGVVYLFETDADGDWVYKSTIQAPDPEAGARFGASVALNDNTLMVGAPGYGPNNTGKVYFIYVRDEIQSVIASDGTEGNKVRVSWTYDGVRENISRFNVYRDSSLIAQVDPNKDFFFDTDGIPGKEYVYSVTSVTLNDVESLPKADEGWAEPDGIIDGKVVTYVGSNGVPGVNIEAWTKVDGETYRYTATTDAKGSYKIKRVYYGDSSEVVVRAFLEGHEFKEDTLAKEINLIQNQVAMDLFYDLTAYTVKGQVVYNNSNCPIDSVDIYQHTIRSDGTRQLESVKTDAEGNYSFLIQPYSDDISYYEYTIDSTRILLNKSADTTLFSFKPDTIRLKGLDTIAQRTTTLPPFVDQVTYQVDITVRNACSSIEKEWEIQYFTPDKCIDEIVRTDRFGKVTLNLPPKPFLFKVVGVDNPTPATIPVVEYLKVRPRSLNLQALHDSLGIRRPDTTINVNFFYHVTPEIAITNLSGYACDDPAYPVVIDQGEEYTYNITVGERFPGFPEPCAVSEGYLLIRNNAARNIVTRLDFDPDLGPNGRFPEYTFVAGEPSPVAPFMKFMFVEYHTESDGFLGQLVVPYIVQGVAPIPGNDVFVNPLKRNDELLLPLFVLRDPPGDGSSSSIDSGRTFTASYNLSEKNTFAGGIEASLNLAVFGFGGTLELQVGAGGGFGNSSSFEITAETHRSFSTSDVSKVDNATNTDWLTGDAADILVGAGFALQYGLGREVFVTDSCTAVAKTVITTGAEIKTTWAYTMDQIRNLIREYEDRIEDTRNGLVEIVGLTQEETEDFFTVRKLNWEQMEYYHDVTTLPHYALCDPTNFNDLAEPWKSAAESWRREGFCELIGSYATEGGKETFTILPDSLWQWNTDLLNRYNAIKDIIREVSVESPDFYGPLTYDEKYLNKYVIDQGYDQFFGPDAKNITFSGGTSFTESRTVSTSQSDGYTQFAFAGGKLAFGNSWDADAEIDIGAWVGFGGGVVTTSNLKPFSTKGAIKGYIEYKFEREYNSNTTNGVSQTVSYTLSDDDPGDQYSVTIVQGVEPTHTPYFALTGGRTSCPNEPGAIDRDAPYIALLDAQGNGYNNTVYNADPNAPVRFPVQLSNLNPFGEGRWYQLYVVENSNIGGAAVKVNGKVLSTNANEDFFIPSNGSVYATISVEKGPFYDENVGLKIGLRPVCDVYISAVQELNVYWRTPCSDVSIVEPSDGWVINSYAAKMTIKLKDYDPYNKLLKRIEIVYRRLGDQTYTWDTLGSLNRQTLIDYYERNKPTYPYPTYPFVWDISQLNLPDGHYEIMAIANCATGGLRESNKITGKIARNTFSLFGKPEPADGLLSLGDEVSVAFNKVIDCPLAQVEATYSFHAGAPNGPLVNATMACLGNKLIFQLDSLHWYEGQMIYATLNNVKDENGNLQESTVAWSFEVSNNPVYWSPRQMEVTVEKGAVKTFAASLENTGTGNEAYALSNSLSWLQPATANGVVIPSGVPVSFTVDASQQQVGTYQDTISATIAGFTVEHLPVTIHVIKPVPDWSVDGASFAHSVGVIANVSVNNGPLSTDTTDVITAWIDGELRGVGHVRKEGNYYAAYVNVFGHTADEDKTIDFRVWLGSKGAEYQGHVDPSFGTLTFETNNIIYGTTPDPVIIDVDEATDSLQYIPLKAGWNWLSFNTELPDMTVNNVLKSLTPAQNDMMMDYQGNSWDYDNGTWVTTSGVDTVNNEAGYMLYLTADDTLRIAGSEASNDAIFLQQGWNLIGYQIPFAQPLNVGAFSIISTDSFYTDDVFKGADGFSVYHGADTAWYGSLDYLEPWKAYKVKSGTPRVINYQRGGNSPATWNVNPNAYEYAARMLAVLQVDGFEFRDNVSTVAAFVGNECRGVARLRYIPHLNRYEAPLFIYGKDKQEEVNFFFWDGLDDTVYTAAQKIAFDADQRYGTLRKPFILSPEAITTGTDEPRPAMEAGFALSPNPFQGQLLLTFEEPSSADYTVVIHNALGEEVFKKAITSMKGTNRFYLNTDPNMAKGVYFLTVRTDEGAVAHFKVMKQ